MVVVAIGAALAACEEPTSSPDVERAAAAVFEAFDAMDAEGVQSARAGLEAAVPCLGGVLTPSGAARLHIARGMSEFASRNAPAARAHFAAARRIDPDVGLPGVVAEGNPMWKDFRATDLDALPTETLGAPADGVLVLDGRPSNERAPALPVVLQIVDESGTARLSALVEAGATPPAYALRPPTRERRSASTPLWVGAASSAALALGFGGLSAWSYGDYDAADPGSWTDGKRTRTNAFAGAAYGTGAVAAGLGVAAVVVRGKL
ncbi:MAG: hypothetical protein H6737_18880 [Alphaproteobacteria bacterium]|nr:hypothetical protein [Alphaproteobacteria bacterium]